MEKSTILIVEDDINNLTIISNFISQYDIIESINAKQALEILEEEKINLILLDIMMPDIDGFELCKIIKANEKTKNTPIIFLTARTDDESIEKAYNVGAIDYISKPIRSIELNARVKIQLENQNLINRLEYLATRDFLTGIYNRRKFFEIANRLYEESENLYAVMIDVDRFKVINDTYGHDIGDQVLKRIVSLIRTNLNEKSLFARMGGEEFVILFHDDSFENVVDNLNNIKKLIEDDSIIFDSNTIKFTISCGISPKSSSKNIDDFLHNADKNLYEAKNAGRNKIIFRV